MKRIVLICLIVLMVFFSGTALAEIVIIGHKDAPDSELSRKDVEKMYLGKLRQWSDHSRVHPATVSIRDIHEGFLKQFVHKTLSQYKAYWKRMIFTGKGGPPKSLKTEADLVRYVAETPGGIGCVTSEGIPAGSESEIRIINVK